VLKTEGIFLDTINVSKDSYEKVSNVGDIVIREKKNIKLVFRPQIILENQKSPDAHIKGDLIYFRSKNKDYDSCSKVSVRELTDGQCLKITMHSDEINLLCEKISELNAIYKKSGGNSGEYIVFKSDEKLNIPEGVLENNLDILLNTLVNTKNPEKIVNVLSEMDYLGVCELNRISNLANLKKVLDMWDSLKQSDNEKLWQEKFKEYHWILSQIFCTPTLFIKDEAYVGGKTFEGTGGQYVDYIYGNNLTKNAFLIEVKTPKTKLMNSNPYRQGVYSPSSELTGAISQVLRQLDSFYKEFNTLNRGSEEMHSNNIRCVIIAGSFEDINGNTDMLASFEKFRNELRNVEIVTYDELFEKIKTLIDILSE
jgi:hypothetical protein